ncbi:g172 [Coccomyxa elongata]
MAAGSSELVDTMESLFANTEARIITAYKVIKCTPSTTSAWTKKKQPKPTGKERVICLTAERRHKRRGFKGSIHTCKSTGQGSYQIRKSWPLKHLSRVEAFSSSRPDGRPLAVELWFVGNAFSSEAKLACEAHTPVELLDLLGTLYLFCKKHEGRTPTIVGYEVSELENWGVSQAERDAVEGVGAFGAVLLGDEEQVEGDGDFGASKAGPGGSMVSAKEERDLAALLDLFALGVGDVEEFQDRLQAELTALEAANVHAVLEGGPMVASVLQRAGEAANSVDDLAESLAIFDLKLRHMREDIAAIEARNNRLERQARHNNALLEALEQLLDRLVLPEQTERVLASNNFTYAMLPSLAEAGWDVWERLAALEPADSKRAGGVVAGQLEPGLAGMTAVVEQRNRLQMLSRIWVERAARFVTDELTRLAEGASAHTSSAHNAARLQTPDHSRFHERAEALAPLLQVVQAMRPSALPPLADRYCTAINALLRRELHAYTSELRRLTTARMAAAPTEPDILKGYKKDGGDARQALHRLASSNYDGQSQSVGELMPHSALQRCLDMWVPALINECDFAAAFLLLYRPVEEAHAVPGANAEEEGLDGGRHEEEMEGEEVAPPVFLTAEGVRQLGSLMDGIEHDFLGMVDLVAKQHQLLSIPMMAEVLGWRQRVAAEPVAEPLAHILDVCSERLLANLERYVHDSVLAISRYDGRGAMSLQDSVKSQHILPFFPNFVLLANRLESLLAGTQGHSSVGGGDSAGHDAAQRVASGSASTESMARLEHLRNNSYTGRSAGWDNRSGRHGSAGADRGGDLDDIDYVSEEADDEADLSADELASGSDGIRPSYRDGRQVPTESLVRRLEMAESLGAPSSGRAWSDRAGSRGGSPSKSPTRNPGALTPSLALPPASLGDGGIPDRMPSADELTSVRQVVDATYAVLVRAMFAQLERTAVPDVKHGDRLRLENYTLFETELRPLASRNPVLAFFVAAAGAAKESALLIYVQQQLEYAKLWKLFEFSQRVDVLLEAVEVEEVAFQAGCQASELRAILTSALASPQRKLAAMHSRIRKHLGTTAPKLAAQVWQRLQTELLRRYVQLEEQMAMCYPSMQLTPSPQELEELCKSIGMS